MGPFSFRLIERNNKSTSHTCTVSLKFSFFLNESKLVYVRMHYLPVATFIPNKPSRLLYLGHA